MLLKFKLFITDTEQGLRTFRSFLALIDIQHFSSLDATVNQQSRYCVLFVVGAVIMFVRTN